MVKRNVTKGLVLTWLLLFASFASAEGRQEATTEQVRLRFYFPVAVAGTLSKLYEEMVADFTKANPDIYVEPVYAGDYADCYTKSTAAAQGGNPPDLAVHSKPYAISSIDAGVLLPIDKFIEKEGGESFTKRYIPAFLADCKMWGQTWGIPQQRSTPIFYYNGDIFRENGLDPQRPPDNWDELVEFSKKLTVTKSGQVVRWGVQIPLQDQWLVSAFIMQNGGNMNDDQGKRTTLTTEEAVGALQFLTDLAQKHKVMPAKQPYAQAASDFVTGNAAMIYSSTGSLGFIRTNAKFQWHTTYLPKGKLRANPTGGGNFYMYKGISQAHQEASWKFMVWMSNAENSARFSIGSGYVAANVDAFNTQRMMDYLKQFPQASTAKNQLQYARAEPPTTHSAGQIARIFINAAEKAVAGVASPRQAFEEAQAQCDEILKAY